MNKQHTDGFSRQPELDLSRRSQEDALLTLMAELHAQDQADLLEPFLQETEPFHRPSLDAAVKKDIVSSERREALRLFLGSLQKVGRRAAVVLCTCCISFMVLFCSVDAFRKHVLSFVLSAFDEYTEFQVISTDNAPAPSLDIATVPIPTYIPDGFVEGSRDGNLHVCQVIYEGSDNILRYSCYAANVTLSLDTENCSKTDVTINDQEGFLYKKLDDSGYCSVVWHDDHYFYLLTSTLPPETMLQIAKSVQ